MFIPLSLKAYDINVYTVICYLNMALMQDSFCDFLRSFLSMCFWLLYLTIRVKKNFNALISISLGLNYEFNKIKLEKDRIERIVYYYQ